MPLLTITTDNPVGPPSRSPSPKRPSMSPITPPLVPEAPPRRQTYTHTQPEQVGAPIPAPEPIAFDSNPDVMALKSAISVLQMQRMRAAADMQKLRRIKDEIGHEPEAFMKDLSEGRVNAQGDAHMADNDEDDDEDDDDSDEEDDDLVIVDGDGSLPRTAASKPKEWLSLPKPQEIVRCPPINWTQYAVVEDSLDKLHAEQVSRPMQGSPAVFKADGTYEFKGDGHQEQYPGVAAPYAPTKDKIEKKAKAKK